MGYYKVEDPIEGMLYGIKAKSAQRARDLVIAETVKDPVVVREDLPDILSSGRNLVSVIKNTKTTPISKEEYFRLRRDSRENKLDVPKSLASPFPLFE